MTLAPMIHSAAFLALAAVAAAILGVYALGARARLPGAATLLRLLAVAGLVIPAWTLVAWYQELSQAREVATRMAIRAEPIVERLTHWSTLIDARFAPSTALKERARSGGFHGSRAGARGATEPAGDQASLGF